MKALLPRTVEVVIPFRHWDPWVEESVRSALLLHPPCGQVTLVPDSPLSEDSWMTIRGMDGFQQQVREVPSGPFNPGRKRNLAMANSAADFFGFFDADARAFPDWLGKGLPAFEDERVAIVGGPNLTPPEDHVLQKACGDVMASPLGMGAAYIRHVVVRKRDVTEMPTCNMLVRNMSWLRFNPELDTSEDMAFCGLAILNGYRVVYNPMVKVFHHRRRLGMAFIRQFHDYGLYQGRRATWKWLWRAAPLGLILYLAVLIALLALVPGAWRILLVPLWLYLLVIGAESIRLTRGRARMFLTFSGFPAAHVAYGWGYLRGWVSCCLARQSMGHAPSSG